MLLQYGYGNFAPGYKGGDAGRYACGHHLLVAHGQTKALYDHKYRTKQVRQNRISCSWCVHHAQQYLPMRSVHTRRCLQLLAKEHA